MRRRAFIAAAPAIVLFTALSRNARAFDHDAWLHGRLPGQLVARFKPGIDPSIHQFLRAILRRHEGHLRKHFHLAVPRAWDIRCPEDQEVDLASELEASGLTEYVHQSIPLVSSSTFPNDPNYISGGTPAQHAYFYINAEDVWSLQKLADLPAAWIPPHYVFDLNGLVGSWDGTNFTPTVTQLNILQGWNTTLGTPSGDLSTTAGNANHSTSMMGIACSISNDSTLTPNVGWGGKAGLIKTNSDTTVVDGINWILSLGGAIGGVTSHPYVFSIQPGAAYLAAFTNLRAAGFLSFGATGDRQFGGGATPCLHGPCDIAAADGMVGVAAVDGLGPTPYAAANAYSNWGASARTGGCGATMATIGGRNGAQDNIPQIQGDGTITVLGAGTSQACVVGGSMCQHVMSGAVHRNTQRIQDIMTDQNLTIAATGFTPTLGCSDFHAIYQAVQAARPTSLR